MTKMLRKCNVKQMALGALALTALMLIPKVSDPLYKGVTVLRNKVAGRA